MITSNTNVTVQASCADYRMKHIKRLPRLVSFFQQRYNQTIQKSNISFRHMVTLFLLESSLKTYFEKCICQINVQELGFQKITISFTSDLSLQKNLNFIDR